MCVSLGVEVLRWVKVHLCGQIGSLNIQPVICYPNDKAADDTAWERGSERRRAAIWDEEDATVMACPSFSASMQPGTEITFESTSSSPLLPELLFPVSTVTWLELYKRCCGIVEAESAVITESALCAYVDHHLRPFRHKRTLWTHLKELNLELFPSSQQEHKHILDVQHEV